MGHERSWTYKIIIGTIHEERSEEYKSRQMKIVFLEDTYFVVFCECNFISRLEDLVLEVRELMGNRMWKQTTSAIRCNILSKLTF